MKYIELKNGKKWPLNTAYNGYNIDFMQSLPDSIIDLTVTSPPYDNLRTYNGSLDWGEHIWKPILQELFRITKDGGVVVWVVADATIKGSETGTSFKQALYAMNCGFNLHDTMIYRNSKPPMNDNRYQACFEYMFVFSKGKPRTFNPIMVESLNAGKMNKSSTYYNADGTLKERHNKGLYKEKKVKESIWVINEQRNGNFHPAVFPYKLARDHIISWSNKNDLIFDPFMGSFTTAIASYNLQCNWIGCEKEPDYFKAGMDRYETECLQGLLGF